MCLCRPTLNLWSVFVGEFVDTPKNSNKIGSRYDEFFRAMTCPASTRSNPPGSLKTDHKLWPERLERSSLLTNSKYHQSGKPRGIKNSQTAELRGSGGSRPGALRKRLKIYFVKSPFGMDLPLTLVNPYFTIITVEAFNDKEKNKRNQQGVSRKVRDDWKSGKTQ